MLSTVIIIILYVILAPVAGMLLTGLDRIITARLQGRVGPPLLQPYYDVRKLFEKETLVVRKSQNFYIVFYLLFIIITGILFYLQSDLLLVIFSLTLGGIFFIMAGYKGSSPYSYIGAERELIQMMSYEPMVLMMAIGMYMVTNSFKIDVIMNYGGMLVVPLFFIFCGFLYVLTIKLRKSPFDLSTSHHGHQELVKGITTEFSGSALAMIEMAHWYELTFVMGFVYLFFASNPWIGLLAVAVTYFLEILIDNTFARVRWQFTLAASWLVAGVLGIINFTAILFFL